MENNKEEISTQDDSENGIPFHFKLNNKYFMWGLTAFLVVAAGLIFYYIVFHGESIKANFSSLINVVMPIIFGLVMAYLLTPILNFAEYSILIPIADRMNIPESQKRNSVIRGLGIIITTFLFFAVIYGLVHMLLSQIVPSIINLTDHFDEYMANLAKWIEKLLYDNPDLSSNLTYLMDKYSVEIEKWLNSTVLPKTSDIIKTVSLSLLGAMKVLWNFIIGLVMSIYLLASKERFAGQAKKITYSMFSRPVANHIINDFRFTHKTFIGFLSGKVIDSIIIGLLCFIGTTFLGTPYAALVSTVIGVTNVIPFFGPYLGAIPSALLILLVEPSHPLNCVYFVLFILLLQQFDGNFLGPKILGDSTGLTGFWIIFAITFFSGVFGVLGMIVGVPIFAVIYAAVKALVNASLYRKNMPQDTETYMNVGYIDKEGFHEYVPDYKVKKAERDALRLKKLRAKNKEENNKEDHNNKE